MSAGNLLPNTEFATTNGWSVSENNAQFSFFGRNPNDDYWTPRGGNTLLVQRGGSLPGGSYVQITSDPFPVTPDSVMQVYGYTASHRSRGWISLFFYDADGNWQGYAGEGRADNENNGGPGLQNWNITGFKTVKVPPIAVQARFAWRTYESGGQADPSSWLFRPYVGMAREGQTEWNPYTPGSGKVDMVNSLARITAEETARATADSALAGRASTLEARVGGHNSADIVARLGAEETARANADSSIAGRVSSVESRAGGLEARTGVVESTVADVKRNQASARLELSAVTAGGRASITLRSDNNSGAGVDIVGDVNFKGVLDVSSTDGSGTTKYTNKGMEVYAPNGRLVLRAGRW